MKSIDKVLQKYREEFQQNKGKGFIRLSPPIEYTDIIYDFIINILNKRPNSKILIVVDEFDKRLRILNYIKFKTQNDVVSSNIVILTEKYININSIGDKYILTIAIDCYDCNILKALSANKFSLILFNNINFSSKQIDSKYRIALEQVRNILPELSNEISQSKLMVERIYQPVGEHRIGIELTDDSKKLYDKYEEYIKESMSIFGDIETVNKCRIGDVKNNLSAIDVRYNIAIANGWDTKLDCSIEYNKKIDDCFNPNAIAERAEQILNIIRLRKDILYNAEEKLESIKNIINDNLGKRILIVSKNGEYAKKIKNYLNEDCDIPICGEYHDCIDDSYFNDANGETITYKTGANKGKPKIFKSQAISSMWEETYNKGVVNILSIKESSNTALNIDAEIVIFTSSLLKNIFEFKSRFNNIKFINENTEIYRLYTINTVEEKQLLNETQNEFTTILSADGQNLSFDN